MEVHRRRAERECVFPTHAFTTGLIVTLLLGELFYNPPLPLSLSYCHVSVDGILFCACDSTSASVLKMRCVYIPATVPRESGVAPI